MTRKVFNGRLAIATAAMALLLTTGSAGAQDIIIDSATGEPLRIQGMSQPDLDTLRGGGAVGAVGPGGEQIVIQGETYIPGTWIDPDGCEHWVMDDGIEGFMAPKLTRDGSPICNGGSPTPPRTMVTLYDKPYHGKYGGKW